MYMKSDAVVEAVVTKSRRWSEGSATLHLVAKYKIVDVFKGDVDQVLNDVKNTKADIGGYLLIEGLGLLGLSTNKSKIEHELAMLRKKSRGAILLEAVASVPQIEKALYNKVIAITGGAMGYGEGLARKLFAEGANVVIMDINEKAGRTLSEELNSQTTANRTCFVKANVTSLESVEEAVYETVLEFGGLDVMISNAGVLKAGGIEEMDAEAFDFVTRVNYYGFYNWLTALRTSENIEYLLMTVPEF